MEQAQLQPGAEHFRHHRYSQPDSDGQEDSDSPGYYEEGVADSGWEDNGEEDEDALLFEDDELLDSLLLDDDHNDKEAEAAVVAAAAAALADHDPADGEALDIFLDDYFPANFMEEPYPEESGLGSFGDMSPTIPEELVFEEQLYSGDAVDPEIVHAEEAGIPVGAQPSPNQFYHAANFLLEQFMYPLQPSGEHEHEHDHEHDQRQFHSSGDNDRHLNVQSRPKLDAVAKQKALLQEMAKRKEVERHMLEKQARLKALHREKLKQIILANAAESRGSTLLAPTAATEHGKVTRPEVRPVSEEEQRKLNEEKHKQVAKLRKKFKEQHKRLLASLIQKKQEQKQRDLQLKAEAEEHKERVRRIAEKKRRASLEQHQQHNSNEQQSLAAQPPPPAKEGAGARHHTKKPSHHPSSSRASSTNTPASGLAVGSGVTAVRARTAGDVLQNAQENEGYDTTPNAAQHGPPLLRDSVSAGAGGGGEVVSEQAKAVQLAAMKERRARLQEYLAQLKQTRKEKEVAAAKEKLRMQKRAELLQQRILSKSAGNLLTTSFGAEQQKPTNLSDNVGSEDGDAESSDQEQTRDAEAIDAVPPTAPTREHSRRAVSSFVARHLANQAKMIEPRDFAAWKKLNGVPPEGKVFAMTGWYPCVKQCLLDRGWYFNPDRESMHFDLKWTIKSHELKQDLLQPWQLTNHFLRNTVLTTKAGLLRSLRNLSWIANISSDHIHPRAYDLNNPTELQDFITDYRCLKAESILKAVYHDVTGLDEPPHGPVASCSDYSPVESPVQGSPAPDSSWAGEEEEVSCPEPIIPLETYMVNHVVLEAACNLCRRQQRYLEDGFLDEPHDGAEPLLTELEWEILSTCSVCSTAILPEKPPKPVELDVTNVENSDANIQKQDSRKHWNKYRKARQSMSEKLNALSPMTDAQLQEVHKLLIGLRKLNPQFALNGLGNKCGNLWVVKPAAKARGQGIRTFRNLDELLQYIGLGERSHGTASQWIVQKYIENPLIIANRKFDLRQWVLVTSWNPLTVYFYHTCYLRFGVEPYSTTDDDLSNQFVHLVNNSIGKHSEHFERVILEEVTGREIRGFMLTSDDFAEYLRISTGEDLFHTRIQPQMKNIARWASMCAVDGVEHRKNSWELFGYDFMIDSHFKPWLIEVNSSPACDYSTEVTKQYVQAALQDIIKVVLDRREWEALPKNDRPDEPDVGGWELIYKGPYLETPIAAFGAEMSLKGASMEVPKPVRPAPPVPIFRRRAASVKAATTNAEDETEQGEQHEATTPVTPTKEATSDVAPAVQSTTSQLNPRTAEPFSAPMSVRLGGYHVRKNSAPDASLVAASASPPSTGPSYAQSELSPVVQSPTESLPLDGMMLMGKSMAIKAKRH